MHRKSDVSTRTPPAETSRAQAEHLSRKRPIRRGVPILLLLGITACSTSDSKTTSSAGSEVSSESASSDAASLSTEGATETPAQDPSASLNDPGASGLLEKLGTDDCNRYREAARAYTLVSSLLAPIGAGSSSGFFVKGVPPGNGLIQPGTFSAAVETMRMLEPFDKKNPGQLKLPSLKSEFDLFAAAGKLIDQGLGGDMDGANAGLAALLKGRDQKAVLNGTIVLGMAQSAAGCSI